LLVSYITSSAYTLEQKHVQYNYHVPQVALLSPRGRAKNRSPNYRILVINCCYLTFTVNSLTQQKITLVWDCYGYFTPDTGSFWIGLSLRPKTETKRLDFGLRPELRLTNHCGAHHCSLHNVIADISVFLCLFLN